MAAVGSKDTKYEVLVRSALHRQGFRFRKNDRRYPGRPDIFLPKYRTAIFINGCFWHGHDNCRKATIPKTRTDFWAAKIARTAERDREHADALTKAGFCVVTIWECDLKAGFKKKVQHIIDEIRE